MVIPVKDGGDALRRCLDAIARQEIDEELEVVVVDSGSTDGSVELARRRGARVVEVAASEFNHGASRNLGAAESRGDVLVFTTQDAYAASGEWLARLVAPLRRDPGVAGVYGRQLPHEHATPPEQYFLGFLYGADPRVQRVGSPAELSLDTTIFSNVNAAMPRRVWATFPFAEDMIMSEDQDWSRRVLLSGRQIVYAPGAAVRHSHAYTVTTAFKRFFDSGVSAERAYLASAGPSNRALRRAAFRYGRGEAEWLWRTGRRRWLPYASVYELAKFAGLQLGVRHRRLPLWLKRRLSALPGYWR